MALVTVAIPVRNGGALLKQTLCAVTAQKLDPSRAMQLLVCDSGSTDGSADLARAHGADMIEIRPEEFSHGRTRNLLMEHAQGTHVALLTQDATPADERWLSRLLAGFQLADDIALTFGPYLPRAGASPMVARELTDWFRFLSPDGQPRLDRLSAEERDISVRELLGGRGFFTDANGCVLKEAWDVVPFRPVAYGEDHVLAHDMLRAGFAKAYLPDARVIHSHDYSSWEWLRRSFDEARAMQEVYRFDEQRELRRAGLNVWGLVGADLRFARRKGSALTPDLVRRSLAHHLARSVGTLLGARAARLPAPAVRRLSLEGRR